jgi:hypothetical protein
MKYPQLLLTLVFCFLAVIIGCAESLPPSNHVSGNETKNAQPHVSGAKAPGHISGY